MGIEVLSNLISHIDNLWGYCTKDWLKFQENPGKHHTQRNTFLWWETIQNGFLGIQDPCPLIRCKAINRKKDQLFAQTYGTLSSLEALFCEEYGQPLNKEAFLDESLQNMKDIASAKGLNDFRFGIDVQDKRAKYHRYVQKMHEVQQKRMALGHPSNLPIKKG